MASLVITNIGLLATPLGNQAKRGACQGEIRLLRNAAVAIDDGIISYVGSAASAPSGMTVINAEGRLVTPGLVDCHTHLVFGGWRQQEFSQRLEGVPYLDILAAGGGILATMWATRQATEQALTDKVSRLLNNMLAGGVTTCEAKSGYGLSVEQECKQLRVVKALNERGPVELVSTFLGAHALPPEYADNRQGYLALLCDTLIPLVAQEALASYCDVFCETGVFSPIEARQILIAARRHGLGLKIHADEIDAIGGSLLAAELRATSAEHLLASGPQEHRRLAAAHVIGVLLPATSLFLGKPYAPARDMLDAGMAIAVASDFNPGSSPSGNLQLCMNLACLGYGLTPAETLCAVTLNAAAAIGRADRVGTVECGKQADLLIWEAADLDYIFYRFGTNLVQQVIKNGQPVDKDNNDKNH